MSDSIPASEIEPRPVKWLWRERIPRGAISLVAGLPGKGKSMFAAHVAAELTRRGERVIFSTHQDPLHEVARPRLEVAEADLKVVRFWSPTKPLPAGLWTVRNEIVKHRASLVVLDPIASHLSVSIFNDQSVRQALTPMRTVAEATA